MQVISIIQGNVPPTPKSKRKVKDFPRSGDIIHPAAAAVRGSGNETIC